MLGLAVKITDHLSRVAKAATVAAFRNFAHAAAAIRRTAIASIQVSDEPSAPGQPPHTRNKQLPRAIVFDANADGAVIGPRESIVGEAGAAHEFGLDFRGQDYPERSYMFPALETNLDRFLGEWTGSIGE